MNANPKYPIEMKLHYILTIIIVFLVSGLSAQKRSGSINLGITKKPTAGAITQKAQQPDRKAMKVIKSFPGQAKNVTELIDTLNYPLEGSYAIYTIAGGGYVSGNNAFGDKAKVNVFEYGQPSVLKGVLIDFAWATSNNIPIEIAAWDNSGNNNSPGAKIASTTISLDDIFIDVLNEQTTYIPFETPIALSSTFYLGVVLPTGPDTVAVYTNVDGDTDPATAWEQWSTGAWYPYDHEQSWHYKMAHAIFPIVDAEVGLIANFFADATSVNPGTSVEFFDTSIGDPSSWLWTFEGGNPDSSTDEQPLVEYALDGLYDVQLIVGNGETSDTLLREDYILVTEDIPVETDTLAYPLEGTRVTYRIGDNQGNNGGFVCGTNLYGDLAMANYFSPQEDVKITGMVFDFAVAKGDDQPITLAIWNNQGADGGPGDIIKSATIPMSTIKSDVANNMLSALTFTIPLQRSTPFYAGFQIPTGTNDSLAVWSNSAGDSFPGVAWSQWNDPVWVPINDAASWGSDFNITMGIHPIVEYQTGIHDIQKVESLTIYPNPTKGEFQVDLSAFSNSKTVEVVDMTGGVIFSREVGPSASSIRLDLSEQYTGIYFVRVVSGNVIGVQKVVRY